MTTPPFFYASVNAGNFVKQSLALDVNQLLVGKEPCDYLYTIAKQLENHVVIGLPSGFVEPNLLEQIGLQRNPFMTTSQTPFLNSFLIFAPLVFGAEEGKRLAQHLTYSVPSYQLDTSQAEQMGCSEAEIFQIHKKLIDGGRKAGPHEVTLASRSEKMRVIWYDIADLLYGRLLAENPNQLKNTPKEITAKTDLQLKLYQEVFVDSPMPPQYETEESLNQKIQGAVSRVFAEIDPPSMTTKISRIWQVHDFNYEAFSFMQKKIDGNGANIMFGGQNAIYFINLFYTQKCGEYRSIGELTIEHFQDSRLEQCFRIYRQKEALPEDKQDCTLTKEQMNIFLGHLKAIVCRGSSPQAVTEGWRHCFAKEVNDLQPTYQGITFFNQKEYFFGGLSMRCIAKLFDPTAMAKRLKSITETQR